jgi:hypothetical protein
MPKTKHQTKGRWFRPARCKCGNHLSQIAVECGENDCEDCLSKRKPVLYECGSCGSYHPWEWNGDCRDDANRFSSPEEFLIRTGRATTHDSFSVEVRAMEERLAND